jgi:hypothetical protein
MQKLLCAIGLHKYRSVEITNCFSTQYTDRNLAPIKHIVWYQRCECCGKRRVKDTYKKDTFHGGFHAGIEAAKVAWVEHGKAYLGAAHVIDYTTPPLKKKPTLTVINGDKDG